MAVDPGDELVDIVDDDDVVVATVARREMRGRRLQHRSVAIAVIHPDGRLLVHQRSMGKDVWPGWWDIAVGGVVSSGEGYDEAARRELAEEVGIVGVEPELIGSGSYRDEEVAMIGRCYRVVTAGPFQFADGEVVQTRWVDAAALADMRSTESFLPDSLAVLFPLLDLP